MYIYIYDVGQLDESYLVGRLSYFSVVLGAILVEMTAV